MPNPYLPLWEYIPDGEPRVFGSRVYVYGSHDRVGHDQFCDYVLKCWSAPVDDLGHWTDHGVIFRTRDTFDHPADTDWTKEHNELYAPDVVERDGKYYLFAYIIGAKGCVAVSDRPEGPFTLLGRYKYTIPDSVCVNGWFIDPGVLVDDDGSVYLYSGFYTPTPAIASGFKKLRNDGGVVVKLESDMVTIQENPKLLFPKEGEGSFPNHEFFEASSIRKDGSKYIFAYSSRHNHELCYAVSDYPDRDFTFGGTLVDQGDLFLNGNEEESKAMNYLGNTHGGMLNIGEEWYIFYHRQTNQHSYSRQACAEKLEHPAPGVFKQAEVTSCGLNGDPLSGTGKYEARIACNLWSKNGVARYDQKFDKKAHPYFTQTGKDRMENGDQYIANMRDGAVAGFKYFRFGDEKRIRLAVSGVCSGIVEVSHTPDFKAVIARIPVSAKAEQENAEGAFAPKKGTQPLYFRYTGEGAMNFHTFEMR